MSHAGDVSENEKKREENTSEDTISEQLESRPSIRTEKKDSKDKINADDTQLNKNSENSKTEYISNDLAGKDRGNCTYPAECVVNDSVGKPRVEKKNTFWQRIGIFFLYTCRTDLLVFMSYTAVTVIGSFIAGSLFSGLFNSWYTSDLEERVLQSLAKRVNHAHVPTLQSSLNVSSLKQELDDICQKRVNQTHKYVSNLEEQLNKTRDEVQRNHSTLFDHVLYKQMSVEGTVSTVISHSLNSVWSYLIILLGLGEVVMLLMILPLLKRISGHHDHRPPDMNAVVRQNRNEHIIWGSTEILEKIHPTTLTRGVCTISFHSESATKHERRTQRVLQEGASTGLTPTASFLLHCHEDILRVPHNKVYVVCVDFNERNIILEDPTKGLGDIRLTTVRALHKMGGVVILVYSRDGGSRHLAPQDLYSEHLTSIQMHPELSNLSTRRRMFSIFEEFTQYQKERIWQIVANNSK